MRHAAIVFALALSTVAISANAADGYLHVHVTQRSPHQKTVRVDVPMSFVEAGLSLLSLGHDMRLRVGNGDVNGNDLRRILATVRTSRGPVAIGTRADLRAWREGPALVLESRESGRLATIRIPFELATALASGQGDQVNMQAALNVLTRRGGELLMVDADDAKVQIWVDEESSSR
jgi:hypothetical protein